MEPQNDDGQKLLYETKLSEIIENCLEVHLIEQGFLPFLVTKVEEERDKLELKINHFVTFWQNCPQKLQEPCMKIFIDAIHTASNTNTRRKMFNMLRTLVDRGAITAKMTCDAIVNNEHLVYNNIEMWKGGLLLVKDIIGGLDYKGCRDILHNLLGKAQTLPSCDNISCKSQLEVLFDLVKHLLDRNTNLLPAYFGLNGVNKFFYEDKPLPHYKFERILLDVMESFRPTAQMASIIGRSKLLPIVSHSNLNSYVWRIASNNLKFFTYGPLPHHKSLMEPQHKLLGYVMEQPYSRDVVCSMLNLNKQQKIKCQAVGEQCVEMIIKAIENYDEFDDDVDDTGSNDVTMDDGEELTSNPKGESKPRKVCNRFFWDHLSCQIIYFVLYQFTSFSYIVTSVLEKLKAKDMRKGRDNLMWLLLQFISGSIQKNALEDFLPVLSLYEHLYPEVEPLPNPDMEKRSFTRKMAAICIWVQVVKKAQTDKVTIRGGLPVALKNHNELLQQLLESQTISLTDYRTALVSNAYSTHGEFFPQRMTNLIELIYGVPHKSTLLPGDLLAFAPTIPIDVKLMDSLTVHAKMSLIHSIVTRIMRLVQGKQNTWALSPSVVETYSRLLVYNEIESLGIKGFFGQLLMNVFKEKCWSVLYTLVEMSTYRLHHVQAHYRIQLFSQLHTILQLKQAVIYQLHLCIENTALHLITSLSNTEVQFQMYRCLNEQKLPSIYSPDSEELNKMLVLTLARSMIITGSEAQSSNWCKDILTPTNQATPHSWSSHTLACFPPSICEFYAQNPVQKEDKSVLKRNVETEYRKWKSMAGENDLINHFSSEGSQPLFICVLWKCLLDDNRIMPIAYKVLDNLGPRALGVQLRYFVDYMVLEISTAGANTLVNRFVDSVSDLVWKWNVTSLDRLVLCMSLRSFEGNEAQVCFYIIHALLLRPQEFRNRVNDFVNDNSPDHWKQSNWYEKHMAFHRKYPEKYFFENVPEVAQLPHNQYLPIHFSNVCLRFIPVFDILIHRFLELAPVMKSLETILEHLGMLYKFHSRPLTFLQNTLHYYEKILSDKPNMKRKLLQTIANALKDVKPRNWCLSDDYLQYLRKPADNCDWEPDVDYYFRIVERMAHTMDGHPSYPDTDWRFNEFQNAQTHNLCITAVELMALPRNGKQVGRAIYELVLKYYGKILRKDFFSWLNVVGIIVASLPESYWSVLNDLVVEVLNNDILQLQPPLYKIFHMLDFSTAYRIGGERRCSLLLALCHSFCAHASIGQLSQLTLFFREHWKPLVVNENQFIYVCHIFGPFLPRLYLEKTRILFEITVDLYEMLENVDKHNETLIHMDPITDFLYHVKYMFVGDGVKSEVEKIIRNLRPELQSRLKFISFQNPDQQQQQTQPQQQQQTSTVNTNSFFVNTMTSHLPQA